MASAIASYFDFPIYFHRIEPNRVHDIFSCRKYIEWVQYGKLFDTVDIFAGFLCCVQCIDAHRQAGRQSAEK